MIALGTANVITFFHHPLHLTKSVASFNKLSNERFLFSLATSNRPSKLNIFNVNQHVKTNIFQKALEVMRQVWYPLFPQIK